MRVLYTSILSMAISLSTSYLPWYSSNSLAQSFNEGGARGTAARVIGQRWRVGTSSADVFAGPSVAYSKRGRVYEGEQVTILEVTRSQEWVQVSTPAGIRGWMKVTELNRPQDQVAQDPGRYRRQTQYQYDAQGRRVDMNGQSMGSGQGTDRPFNQSPPPTAQYNSYNDGMDRRKMDPNYRSALHEEANQTPLIISLPVGMTHFTRRFTSDIATSPLSGLKSQVASASFGLAVSKQFNSYLILNTRFVASMGSEVPLPSLPALPEIGEVNIKANQQLGEVLLEMGSPIEADFVDAFWLGGIVGVQYYQSGYKEVQYPAPAERMAPLQNHTYLSAQLGLSMSFKWQEVSWDIKGGGGLPLSFEQSPNSEGQWKSLGLWGQTSVHIALSEQLITGLSFGYLRIGTEYTGPAEQADSTLNNTYYYREASGYDQSIEGLLSIAYRL